MLAPRVAWTKAVANAGVPLSAIVLVATLIVALPSAEMWQAAPPVTVQLPVCVTTELDAANTWLPAQLPKVMPS